MSRVKGKNTGPELKVRRILHAAGYRFRIHADDLPGRPDIVFRSRKKALFVHGCFWHQHSGCKKATLPQSNVDFWTSKLQRNVDRDRKTILALQAMGWSVLVVWECQLREELTLVDSLCSFLAD